LSDAVLIDLSPPIGPDTPVWPGDVAYGQQTHWPMTDGSPVEVSHFTTTAHIGAHADAPAHFVRDGATIGEMPLDAYVGPCQVIDCRSGGPRRTVELAEVQAALGEAGLQAPRLLIKTYAARPTEWDDHFPGLAPAVPAWLGDQGGVLVGVDTASLDPMDSKDLTAHRTAYANGLVILENLDLAEVDGGVYELIALPLRLMIMDASPVRAVLRRYPTESHG
jgi:arylformamidase